MECTIYIGSHDEQSTCPDLVAKMTEYGANVVVIPNGTLKEAMNEALCDMVTNVATLYYLVADASCPHPIPTIVRGFQSISGKEIKEQFQRVVPTESSRMSWFQVSVEDPTSWVSSIHFWWPRRERWPLCGSIPRFL